MKVTKSRKSAAVLLIFGLAGLLTETVAGQKSGPVIYPDDPVEFKNQFIRPTYFPDNITKKPGHYTITDWQNAIDSTWGDGLPKAEKLQIFDRVWNKIDSNFACFNGIDVNWDSLRTVYRGEIVNGDSTSGVSRGRFAGIMNYLTVILRESHTVALDYPVNIDTYPGPGVPLLYIGDWNYNWHFGAGLTPLEDSSLLVYKVIENHPLGLVPGDIILGYDGVAWKDLYPELLEAQLPIRQEYWGSSPSSFAHALLMSAGLNWHLYDSLDVVKFNTGDTLRLATDPLIGLNTEIWCSEQLEIPGVPMPDYNAGERASFGIIESTQIGYIYVNAWSGNAEQEFYNAVDSLMHYYQTTGMIIDFRINWGGDMFLGDQGLSLLFNESVITIDFAQRCNPNDHLAMCTLNIPGTYVIPGNPSTFYDKPIAVLTGPGAVSAGDQVALRMKFHPMVKFFGKQTCAAFNGPVTPSMSDPDWYFRYAKFDAFLLSNPGHYLTHDEFPSEEYFPGIPYEEVWLTPANVAQGIDDVVEAAIDWINSCCYVVGDVNGSDSYNGLDITYGVNFFKYGTPTPQCIACGLCPDWHYCGDVNNSCNYNGLDITYGVNYFKYGSPTPIPCADCPPVE